jgi:hypothetical protein
MEGDAGDTHPALMALMMGSAQLHKKSARRWRGSSKILHAQDKRVVPNSSGRTSSDQKPDLAMETGKHPIDLHDIPLSLYSVYRTDVFPLPCLVTKGYWMIAPCCPTPCLAASKGHGIDISRKALRHEISAQSRLCLVRLYPLAI